jgi:acylphosphatase
VVVSGRVQGVFYRDGCRREAQRLGVRGWVLNTDDGRVEAVFEGEPEDVAAMVEWSHRGPTHAWVERVEVTEEDPQGERGFQVR